MTCAPSVAQQVDVELELLPRRREREHLVVQLLEGSAGPEQAESRADTRDMRVDRNIRQPIGEQQHTGRSLAPDTGERTQVVPARLDRSFAHPLKRQGIILNGIGDRCKYRLDAS